MVTFTTFDFHSGYDKTTGKKTPDTLVFLNMYKAVINDLLSFRHHLLTTAVPADTANNVQSSQTNVDASARRLSWDDPDPTPFPTLESSDPTLTPLTHD